MIQLVKESLDNYKGGQLVPAFQLELKMVESEPEDLEQRVGFIGVKPEGSYIRITRNSKLHYQDWLLIANNYVYCELRGFFTA